MGTVISTVLVVIFGYQFLFFIHQYESHPYKDTSLIQGLFFLPIIFGLMPLPIIGLMMSIEFVPEFFWSSLIVCLVMGMILTIISSALMRTNAGFNMWDYEHPGGGTGKKIADIIGLIASVLGIIQFFLAL